MSTTVHIVLPVHDGRPYLAEQVRSLQAQTHESWRLWVRDDGSTDGSAAVVRELAGTDSRIRLHEPDGRRLGATRSFAWLLERLPADATYVMLCDHDDRWLPQKIERSLEAMRAEEEESPGPVLVHTDLVVVDRDLRVVHPSLWEYQRIVPQPATLRRLLANNTVTGCTVLVNRPLLEGLGTIPPEASHHDRWMALVAAVCGRVVSVEEPTVLYRQHGRNTVGASDLRGGSPGALLRKALSPARMNDFRRSLVSGAREAAVLLERYGEELSRAERVFLEDYARFPEQGLLGRKLQALRLRRRLPEFGFLRTLAAVLRA